MATAGQGVSRIAIFDVPRYPPVSIGQFQHANLSRYTFEPVYLVGNSYANPRIALGSVTQTNFDGVPRANLFDTAYLVNDQIFDEYFLSTIDANMSADEFSSLAAHNSSLYNTRYQMVVPEGGTLDTVLNLDSSAALNAWGGRFMVDGAFNVNSTSVDAWKAVFSSMDQPFLKIDVRHSSSNAAPLHS